MQNDETITRAIRINPIMLKPEMPILAEDNRTTIQTLEECLDTVDVYADTVFASAATLEAETQVFFTRIDSL